MAAVASGRQNSVCMFVCLCVGSLVCLFAHALFACHVEPRWTPAPREKTNEGGPDLRFVAFFARVYSTKFSFVCLFQGSALFFQNLLVPVPILWHSTCHRIEVLNCKARWCQNHNILVLTCAHPIA